MALKRPAFDPPWRRSLLLEHKLPLATSALLLFLLALYTWIGYREVARAGAAAASERDERVVSELTQLTAQSSLARARLMGAVVNRSAVRAALKGAAPIETIDSALAPLRTQPDSTLKIVVYDAQRRPVRFIEETPDPETIRRVDPAFERADRRDSLSVTTPFFEHQGRAHFWSVAAVRENGKTLGYIAHFRPLRTSDTGMRTLNNLIGPDNRILFANRDDPRSPLIQLDGVMLSAPESVIKDEVFEGYHRSGASYITASDTIAATPYRLIVETPRTTTDARARQFLKRTGLIGLVLLIAGTLIVWITSRRITRPIGELNAAAARIAEGDYGRQVHVGKHDEIGQLANSFNQMSNEIQSAMLEAEDSRAEAEQANRAKSEFLANMSHEIRTPINAMLGYADLIDAGVSGPITEQQRQQLERIRISGRHLTRLIDDLLDFTRLETARLSIQPRVAAAAEAVATALTVVEPEADAKPVAITTKISADPQYIGDPQRVEQILVNLLGNAVKFTPAHGSVRLDCRTTRMNGGRPHTEFVVEDTGPGIPADRMASVFEPFVQGESGYTRPHGGSGLGLTISRRLAELMDGSITVQSEEGAGARFTLTLPAPS